MSGQCSLCLSCGAPFIPLGEDVVEYDRLGNISVFFFQKLVKRNDLIQRTVKNPSFCAKPNASHILHESHHRHAVEFVIEKMLLHQERDDDYFPFLRNPKGKTPVPMLAKFIGAPRRRAVDFRDLSGFIDSLQQDGHQEPDYSSLVVCCQDCNLGMTMKFWFKYHLCAGSEVNPSCLIKDGKVKVFSVLLHGSPRKLEASHRWRRRAEEGSYPLAKYSERHDVLTAMLGYYVHQLCFPHETPGLPAKPDHYRLYLHMCWVVLEVTCLLCEYWRGSRDAENLPGRTQKRNRCCKTPLGSAELYFSYFCWRIGGFRHRNLRALDFKTWHQIYMWHASGCEKLFPRPEGAAGSRLMADRISPDDMNAGSRELVQTIARNMTAVLKNSIMPLVRHVAGVGLSRELNRYFIPRKYLQELHVLMMRSVAAPVPPARARTHGARPQGGRAGLRFVRPAGGHRRHDGARHRPEPRPGRLDPPAAPVLPERLAPGRGPEHRAGHGQGRGRAGGGRRPLPAVQAAPAAPVGGVGRHDGRGRAADPAGPAVLALGRGAGAEPAGRVRRGVARRRPAAH